MTLRRFLHPRSLIGSGVALLGTALAHQRWKVYPPGTPQHGLLDLACHLGTACAVTVPVLPNARYRREFGVCALASAVALDLDHVVAARSLEVRRWMTMPSRPPTHSIFAMVAMAWTAERMAPGKRLWLAVALGVGSHLLRDLATGGAPLWHPRRSITWPVPTVIVLLTLLPIAGWYLAGLPLRRSPAGRSRRTGWTSRRQ